MTDMHPITGLELASFLRLRGRAAEAGCAKLVPPRVELCPARQMRVRRSQTLDILRRRLRAVLLIPVLRLARLVHIQRADVRCPVALHRNERQME